MIGTGIYLEDIGLEQMQTQLEQEAKYLIWTSILIGLVFLVLGSLTSMYLVDDVIKPLIQARHVANRIAKGDFSKRTLYASKSSFNRFSLDIG